MGDIHDLDYKDSGKGPLIFRNSLMAYSRSMLLTWISERACTSGLPAPPWKSGTKTSGFGRSYAGIPSIDSVLAGLTWKSAHLGAMSWHCPL